MSEPDMQDIEVRDAQDGDLPAIWAIYSAAVLTGTASFEIEAPSLAEMTRRWSALVDADYPYLVAIGPASDPATPETLLGYAYAGPYRPRPAYRFAVENSVYVAPEAHGRGVGRRLMRGLIAVCEARGFRRMIAVIGDSNNRASVALHAASGFHPVGVLPAIGFKQGRWLDSVLMQRSLGEGDATPPTG